MSKAGSVRGSGRTASGTGSDADHELREGLVPDYVNVLRSPLNSVIIETKRGPELTAICEERRGLRETKRKMKSNACVAQSILISFGKEIQPDFDALPIKTQDALYLKLMEKIAKEARTNVSGLVAHRDETAPHAHGQLVGYNREGTPLTKVMNRQFRKDMQDWMVEIFSPHLPELERGVPKSVRLARGEDASTTIHKSVAELHGSLLPQIEKAKNEIEVLRAEAATIQTRINKLQAKENLTATKEKTLAAYERRLEAREAEISKLEAETARLNKLSTQAFDAAVEEGKTQGRAEVLKEAKVAKEAAQTLISGELRLGSLSEQAAFIRNAVNDIPSIRRAEDARMRMSTGGENATWAWSSAASNFASRLGEEAWQSAQAQIVEAHERGQALLEKLPKNVSFVERVRGVADRIAEYWNMVGAAFSKLINPFHAAKELIFGLIERVLPKPINEYGYVQPLMRDAEQEIAALGLAQKLQQQNDFRQ